MAKTSLSLYFERKIICGPVDKFPHASSRVSSEFIYNDCWEPHFMCGLESHVERSLNVPATNAEVESPIQTASEVN